jgi:hypothetical protein
VPRAALAAVERGGGGGVTLTAAFFGADERMRMWVDGLQVLRSVQTYADICGRMRTYADVC